MKKIIFTVIGLLICSQMVFSQNAKNAIEIKSKDVIKTRNVNPYIKITAPQEDVAKVLPPTSKGGEKKNNEIPTTVDNSTSFYVEIYIDGVYQGTVPPWGTLTFTLYQPYKQIYCITTGGSKDWLMKGDYNNSINWILK